MQCCKHVRADRSRSPHKPELRSKVHLEVVKDGDAEFLNLRECKVCYDLPIRTVFVKCGHIDPAPLARLLCLSLQVEVRCASPIVYDMELCCLESKKRQVRLT